MDEGQVLANFMPLFVKKRQYDDLFGLQE